MTANRVAALTAFLTGIGATVISKDRAIRTVGLAGSFSSALLFMWGAQKSDTNDTEIEIKQLELASDEMLRGMIPNPNPQ